MIYDTSNGDHSTDYNMSASDIAFESELAVYDINHAMLNAERVALEAYRNADCKMTAVVESQMEIVKEGVLHDIKEKVTKLINYLIEKIKGIWESFKNIIARLFNGNKAFLEKYKDLKGTTTMEGPDLKRVYTGIVGCATVLILKDGAMASLKRFSDLLTPETIKILNKDLGEGAVSQMVKDNPEFAGQLPNAADFKEMRAVMAAIPNSNEELFNLIMNESFKNADFGDLQKGAKKFSAQTGVDVSDFNGQKFHTTYATVKDDLYKAVIGPIASRSYNAHDVWNTMAGLVNTNSKVFGGTNFGFITKALSEFKVKVQKAGTLSEKIARFSSLITSISLTISNVGMKAYNYGLKTCREVLKAIDSGSKPAAEAKPAEAK